MKYRSYIFTLLCFTCLLLSCRQEVSPRIEHEKSFAEIAQVAAAEGNFFAIMLVDPDCPPCRKLYDALGQNLSCG